MKKVISVKRNDQLFKMLLLSEELDRELVTVFSLLETTGTFRGAAGMKTGNQWRMGAE